MRTKIIARRGYYIVGFIIALAIPLRHLGQLHAPANPQAAAPSYPASDRPKPGQPGRSTDRTHQAAPGSGVGDIGHSSAISFGRALARTPTFGSANGSGITPKATSVTVPKRPASTNPLKVTRNQVAKTLTVGDVVYPLRTYAPVAMPNDPRASQPWITNTGMSQAWDTPVGNHDTLLAVIDTGFALKHEEFANRWYTNPGESGTATSEAPSRLNCTDRGLGISASCNLIDDDADGTIDNETGPAKYQNPSRLNCTAQGKPLTKDCNQIDDDTNGYVDDVSGWDFANNDNLPQAGELNPLGPGTSHGTETAGTAAATGDNGKGIAGADWHTKILPLQALDDDAYGDTLGVGRAIRYATARHADVISISLGSSSPDDYVRQAIATAIAGGSVVVVSAGNSRCDCMLYPANYPEVVAVGALDTSNSPAYFTSYGANLDVMAPGTQITAPTWTAGNPSASYATNLAGTSFSAPIVSGLLTRLLSIQPNDSSLQLIAALTENTNRSALPATVSRIPQLGYGRVDALAATMRVITARSDPFTYTFAPVSKGTFLFPSAPTELTGVGPGFTVQQCSSGQLGTTPLYELTKPGFSFWSISQTEVWQAQNSGYTSRLFAEACLQQPQDTPVSTRSLNLFKEFRNIYEGL